MITTKTAKFYLMMLQVLDDPTDIRIIVNTTYPDFSDTSDNGNAYFMIDRADCGGVQKTDADGKPMVDEDGCTIWEDPTVYDYWKVSDSIGQSREFDSNVELIEFIDSIEGLIKDVHVESF